MNARVLIIDDGSAASLEMAKLVAQELEERQPEDTGLGYMEFFDWLAGVTNQELEALDGEPWPIGHIVMTAAERHERGLRIWQNM